MTHDSAADEEIPTVFWTLEEDAEVQEIFRGEFAGQRDSLRGIRELAETAAASTPLQEMAIAEFEMAIDEICANVVEHGYEKLDEDARGEGTLVIEIGRYLDRLEAIVTDYSAIRFHVDTASTPGIATFNSEQRERGLGLDIIRHCVDKVEYQWLQPQGNQTRLVKYYISEPLVEF